MQYRSFPKAPGLQVSRLGFGCTRLPTLCDDPPRVDEAAATQLLHEAVAAGVNYVDASWPRDRVLGEELVGRALSGGRREQVQLAAKAPAWLVKEEADWERMLEDQLRRLGTDRIDFYLLPALGRDRWAAVQRLGGVRALERARADGRVVHVGFSFGGSAVAELDEILGGHDWDCCELELNLLDAHRQPGSAGLRRAADRKVGVIVADPLRGGALAEPPPVVQDAWSRSDRPWSPAAWALRWVWNHAEVVAAVVGMGSSGQLRDAVGAAAGACPLSAPDLERIEDVKRVYRSRRRLPCTACGTCQPCPSLIPIADVLSLYNDAMFDSKAAPAADYRQVLEAGRGADECVACGECEVRCPEEIPIVEKLQEAHAYLTSA